MNVKVIYGTLEEGAAWVAKLLVAADTVTPLQRIPPNYIIYMSRYRHQSDAQRWVRGACEMGFWMSDPDNPGKLEWVTPARVRGGIVYPLPSDELSREHNYGL